jgi:hypothetical protein
MVELRDISFAVNAAGEIAPPSNFRALQINGSSGSLPVDVGDREEGCPALPADDKFTTAATLQLTDIEKRELNVEKAERDYKRAQQLARNSSRRRFTTTRRPPTTWPRTRSSAPRRPGPD